MKRLTALVGLIAVAHLPGVFAGETVERILAVVGSEVVLHSEVEEEVYLARLRGEMEDSDPAALDAYRRDVLEGKIEEKILLEKARAEGIRVTRAEVDEAVSRMVADIRDRFPDQAAFEEQLAAEDMTLDDLRRGYRERVEQQLMVRQLMDRLVRSRVVVEDREIRAYWDEQHESMPPVPAGLELRRILVSPAGESRIDSSAVERAQIVLARLRAGEDFATLATVFSEGPAAERGGEIGWFDPADLEPRLARAVEDLASGGVSEVVTTGRGAHILRVADRREGEVLLQQIVFRADEQAQRVAARARAASLLRRVRKGEESFADVARTESDDSQTAEAGGALGQVPIEALPDGVREKLEPLSAGEVSDVIEGPDGYSIFLVEGRRGDRPATFEEMRDRIAILLEQSKSREIYRKLIDEARRVTYVDNRLDSES